MFHWRRAHLIALALAIAATGLTGSHARAADKPAVSMTLQSIAPTTRRMAVLDGLDLDSDEVTFTNQVFYTVVFQVTNSGPVPVSLSGVGSSLFSTNLSLFLGAFGRCR